MSASALFTSSNATKSTPYCLFCKQGHYPEECQIVTDLSERRNILKEIGHCFNCMRKGHVFSQCDTSIKCNFCKDKHHAALCLKKFKSVESICVLLHLLFPKRSERGGCRKERFCGNSWSH